MIDQFWAWLTAQFGTEIFGGLAAVSILGYAGYMLRAVPTRLFYLAHRMLSLEISVRSDDQMFFVVAQWLSKQSFMDKSRRMKIITKDDRRNTPREDDEDARPQYLLVPAEGVHWFWFRGRPILLEIGKGGEGKPERSSFMIIETITMRTLGRNPALFHAVMEEALQQIASERRVAVATNGEYGWSRARSKLPRPLSSVITHDGVGERLLHDMESFFDNRDWYIKHGIPWRRGYLLVGPPGTGKSSLVFALASEMAIPIYSLSLGTFIDDGGLSNLLMSIPERAILLIEDVDTFSVAQSRTIEREGEKKELISLSGLLNALDGVIAGEGRVVIMTTNHPEKLDAALTRSGRVDLTETLQLFGRDECARMWRLFFGDDPHETEFLKRIGENVQPAALQDFLMRHRHDPALAARMAGGFVQRLAA